MSEIETLRQWQAQTMAVLGRVFDDTTDEGRALIARVLQHGQSFLLMDAINRIIDDLEHERRLRAGREEKRDG